MIKNSGVIFASRRGMGENGITLIRMWNHGYLYWLKKIIQALKN
jgi:hypothetical protein